MVDNGPKFQGDPKYMHTIEFDIADPLVVPNGPLGTRCVFAFEKGKVHGPALNGEIIGPSADWATIRPDGSINLDLRILIKTDDDIPCLVKCDIMGRSNRDHDDPSNAVIQSAATFEAGDEKYKYLNHKILVGQGKKTGTKIEVHYFDTIQDE